ncbi:MAG: hypothetical protein HS100_14265 [Anaerolineales bacterium]|nr:MAG: hypothetical protein EDM79_06985 [Chloroflexota bacterium]MBE7435075.1 hypothetical protein [Anaerolineales bacterium]MCE7861804.1 hypothetical protein [Chloroflexi bacterium CFX2]MCK6585612.1 hypothetical protein [Anaerolineales bacterium]
MRFYYWHYGIIAFSLATATLHIMCYPHFGWLDSIVLNGFGTLALLGMYFLPIPFFQKRRSIVYWTFAGYILLTIVLWIFLGDKAFNFATTSWIGYFAKVAEIFLLLFLGFEIQKHLPAQAKKS